MHLRQSIHNQTSLFVQQSFHLTLRRSPNYPCLYYHTYIKTPSQCYLTSSVIALRIYLAYFADLQNPTSGWSRAPVLGFYLPQTFAGLDLAK